MSCANGMARRKRPMLLIETEREEDGRWLAILLARAPAGHGAK